jgi:hypothetical protein
MNLTVAYLNRSGIVSSKAGLAVSLAPNLRRDRVSYDGSLRHPLRFREAISALHDVVVSDLKFKPKDRETYQQFLEQEKKREESIRRAAQTATVKELLADWPEKRRVQVKQQYQNLVKVYWEARDRYADWLAQHDQSLWRLVMPLDPIITVSPDVLFFECFSADESSYACLTVNRDAFTAERDVALGTTNVDYSWALYEHFQELRSYRQTRFTIDPSGFEVATHDQPSYKEEKIDLPPSWLRGFLQLQSAMSLPMRRVPVSREALYGVLAFLRRHKAKKSPRAIRFELNPDQPITIVLEPWEQRFVLHSTPYAGGKAEVIRTWGRDRLMVLARMLPLMESAEVYLLGTGLPSFWSVGMGEMRLLLGLSGWTSNDWTGASALDQIAPPGDPSSELLGDIASAFQERTEMSFEQVRSRTGATAPFVMQGLNRLALLGQVIHDLPAGLYRWRQALPVALSLDQIGSENEETLKARELVSKREVHVSKDERDDNGLRHLAGTVGGRSKEVTLTLDGDGRMVRAKCDCSHHYKSGLRRGPCRHLQALRSTALQGTGPVSLERWFEQVWN